MSSAVQIWGVIILYLAVCIGMGLYLNNRKKMQTSNEYFMNSNSMTPLAVALSLVGAVQSAVAFLGQPGTVYLKGYGQMIAVLMLGAPIGMITASILIGKPMHHMAAYKKYNSCLEMLIDIYQEKRLSFIVVPAIVIGSFVYATVQWVAIGRMFSTLGLNLSYNTAIIIGFIAIGAYVIFGGNSTNSTVSIFQMFVAIFASLFIVGLALSISGGMTKLNTDLAAVDSSLVSLTANIGPWTFFSFIVLYAYGLFAMPHVSYKFMQLKDVKLIPLLMLVGCFTAWVTGLNPFGSFAMRVKVANGEVSDAVVQAIETSSDTVIPNFIHTYASPIMTGLLVAACLACIMTTIAAHVVLFSSAMVNDIGRDWLHKDVTGPAAVKAGRIVSAVFMVVTAALAFNPPQQMFTVVNIVNGLQTGVIATPLLLGLRWRRATKQGALTSMIVSFIITVVPWVLELAGIWQWPLPIDRGAFAILISIPLMIIVSLATPAQEKPFMPPTLAELKARKAAQKA